MIKTVSPGTLSGHLRIIPSKSVTHRALLVASMARGETELEPVQLSQDISATLDACQQLGLTSGAAKSTTEHPDFLRIRIMGQGTDRSARSTRSLDCGESGSTLRFLIPLALDGRGPVRFIGHGRLMQRPLDLYESLFRPQGILWEQRGNVLTVDGKLNSGEYSMPGNVSSQFITGLLLALPRLPGTSTLSITTPVESRAYIEITRSIQAAFGIRSSWDSTGQILHVPGSQTAKSPRKLLIEGDWSHAAFYLVAGVIGKNPVTLHGLNMNSAQGDRAIVPILRDMGAQIEWDDTSVTAFPSELHNIEVNAGQIPDLVPILAVAMAVASGESRITGASRLRLKESDRLSAMCNVLLALRTGCQVTDDGLIIQGGHLLRGGHIDGCADHRVVMAAAVAATIASGDVEITDAESVQKSAPAFWEEFAQMGGIAR